MDNETEQKIQSNALVRVADALEEVLRLVKEDQERSRKYMEERKMTKSFRAGSESVQILLHHWRWLEANGYKKEASSAKRQALELDKTKL
jgi:hypothetical protein